MHGYELRQQMKELAIDEWVDIQQGALYPSLQRMTADGLLEIAEVTSEGNRPTRTVYRITPDGRQEHLQLLRTAWADPALRGSPVSVALFFVWFLPAEEIAVLLAQRIDTLEQRLRRLAQNQAGYRTLADAADNPTAINEMMADLFGHAQETLETERRWAERVRRRVAEGVYEFDVADPARSEVDTR
jgi:DNA-binding PadR family transcriptional regulator